jgi:endonuclease/exonuclease/phosphatase (EEP) superfamily protein YafD
MAKQAHSSSKWQMLPNRPIATGLMVYAILWGLVLVTLDVFYLSMVIGSLLMPFTLLHIGIALLVMVWPFRWPRRWYYAIAGIGIAACLGAFMASQSSPSIATQPLYPSQTPATATKPLRILHQNVLFNNTHYQQLIDQIKALQPDFISIQEFSPAWQAALSPALAKTHRYRYEVPIPHPAGIACYSRYPLVDVRLESHQALPYITGAIVMGARDTVGFAAVHLLPPMMPYWYKHRKAHVDALLAGKWQQHRRYFVVGDLNAVPWDPITRRLRRGLRAIDAHPWYIGTFPARLRLLGDATPHSLAYIGIAIDRILWHSPTHTIQRSQLLAPVGSDHLGIFAVCR